MQDNTTLVEKARELMKDNENLSTLYLQRKLKLSHKGATELLEILLTTPATSKILT
jgi:hypothetical protein